MSEALSDTELNMFIMLELKQLQQYDATRPTGHPYAFHEHSMRVADDMFNLALALGANDAQADLLSRVTLLHDIGKRFLPVEIWDIDGKPSETVKAQRRRHTQLGVDYIDSTFGKDNHAPLLDLIRDLMLNHHEAVDGSGWLGKQGDALTPEARMLCICDAFDGYSTWRPHYGERDISPKGVLHRMQVEKANQFDKEILDVFAKIKMAQ